MVIDMAHIEVKTKNPTNPPKWLQDAVIYELNPKTFTSPEGEGEGSGSGTFRSAAEKLPYLKALGVNTIWMAGFTKGNRHFSDFWTVYAMEDPEKVDEALGTSEDLRAFVDEAHRLKIRVVAEAVTHGVTKDSPLTKAHPEWFKGSEWGMADFDYGNRDFREWWIRLWMKHTMDFGFDGYRLDGPNGVSSFEEVLGVWDDIAWGCLEQGHEIAVIGENSRYHVRQCDRDTFTHDMAGDFSPVPEFATMQISCHDEGINMGPGNYYVLRGSRFKFGYCAVFGYNIPLFMAGEEFDANVHSVSALRKKIYEGFENSREIDFYDLNPDTEGGGWLLGNRLCWEEAEETGHREMLLDCQKILKIRNENSDLLHYNRKDTKILPVQSIPKSGSIPYIRYRPGESAILVVGNERTVDCEFILRIPLKEMGFKEEGIFQVVDLWNNDAWTVEARYMKCLRVMVPGDYKAQGGVRVYRIVKLHNMVKIIE